MISSVAKFASSLHAYKTQWLQMVRTRLRFDAARFPFDSIPFDARNYTRVWKSRKVALRSNRSHGAVVNIA